MTRVDKLSLRKLTDFRLVNNVFRLGMSGVSGDGVPNYSYIFSDGDFAIVLEGYCDGNFNQATSFQYNEESGLFESVKSVIPVSREIELHSLKDRELERSLKNAIDGGVCESPVFENFDDAKYVALALHNLAMFRDKGENWQFFPAESFLKKNVVGAGEGINIIDNELEGCDIFNLEQMINGEWRRSGELEFRLPNRGKIYFNNVPVNDMYRYPSLEKGQVSQLGNSYIVDFKK